MSDFTGAALKVKLSRSHRYAAEEYVGGADIGLGHGRYQGAFILVAGPSVACRSCALRIQARCDLADLLDVMAITSAWVA